MNALLVLFIVFMSLLIAYILGFLINLAFVNVFLKKFYEHNHALNIILVQKHELISFLMNLIKKYNFEIDEQLVSLFNSIDIKDYEVIGSEKSETARNNIALLKQELLGISKGLEDLLKNSEYKNIVSSLAMVDNQIRYLIVSYNADVIGYNYWINFKPYKYIFILSGVRKKEII